jgi:hypothetical protein
MNDAAPCAPLGHDLALGSDLSEVFVASSDRLGETPSTERFPNPPHAVVKVHRVVQPPCAVIAPEVVRIVGFIDSKRGIADWHLALLPMDKWKGRCFDEFPKPLGFYREEFEKPFESFVGSHQASPTRILPTCCQVG